MFTDLSHHRTCGSAYGGFVLLHLTVCDKLFSAIPSNLIYYMQFRVVIGL